jgi:hypothetical protein
MERVLVVGTGPARLAMTAELRRPAIDPLVLERGLLAKLLSATTSQLAGGTAARPI